MKWAEERRKKFQRSQRISSFLLHLLHSCNHSLTHSFISHTFPRPPALFSRWIIKFINRAKEGESEKNSLHREIFVCVYAATTHNGVKDQHSKGIIFFVPRLRCIQHKRAEKRNDDKKLKFYDTVERLKVRKSTVISHKSWVMLAHSTPIRPLKCK